MVSTDGLNILQQTRDGLAGFFQYTGGADIMILFGFGTAIIIYLIFKGISERLS